MIAAGKKLVSLGVSRLSQIRPEGTDAWARWFALVGFGVFRNGG